MYMTTKSKSLLVGILMVAFLASSQTAAAAMMVSGSTTVLPLGVQCAEAFQKETGIDVSVSGGGSGVGIKNVAEGLSDVAMASRQVKDSEIEAYGDDFERFVVAYDAICVAVSQEIYDGGVTGLSQDEVMQIYNGEITNWEDVDGPDEEIFVLARQVGSGTRDTFNDMVMGDEGAETEGVNVYVGSNAEMKTAIANSDKAIGYLGFSYAQEGDLQSLAYEGVEPSSETVKDSTYPLARELYMYTWGDPSEDAQEFLDFVMGNDGQAIAEELGFVSVL